MFHPPGPLGAIARHWFQIMRTQGDEYRELLHDGHPTACFATVPFAYVAVFTTHVKLGFIHGATLPDPAKLLQGTGKSMRHLKLRPTTPTNPAALQTLIQTAYTQTKSQVENAGPSKIRIKTRNADRRGQTGTLELDS